MNPCRRRRPFHPPRQLLLMVPRSSNSLPSREIFMMLIASFMPLWLTLPMGILRPYSPLPPITAIPSRFTPAPISRPFKLPILRPSFALFSEVPAPLLTRGRDLLLASTAPQAPPLPHTLAALAAAAGSMHRPWLFPPRSSFSHSRSLLLSSSGLSRGADPPSVAAATRASPSSFSGVSLGFHPSPSQHCPDPDGLVALPMDTGVIVTPVVRAPVFLDTSLHNMGGILLLVLVLLPTMGGNLLRVHVRLLLLPLLSAWVSLLWHLRRSSGVPSLFPVPFRRRFLPLFLAATLRWLLHLMGGFHMRLHLWHPCLLRWLCRCVL
jgi:hypothetical protein